MKKTIFLLLILAICFTLIACGKGEKDTEQALSDTEDKYGVIISLLEKGDYSSAIDEIERIQEEERLAELSSKGIVEIEITLDNWDQYFEYTPTAQAYIKNAFGETTHYNFASGIKLKDEYTMVENGGTDVKFEFESVKEIRSCSVDFSTGEVIIGEAIGRDETIFDTFTTRFSDSVFLYSYIGLNGSIHAAGYGFISQISKGRDDINITKNIDFYTIANMLRVEGKLVIYKNS